MARLTNPEHPDQTMNEESAVPATDAFRLEVQAEAEMLLQASARLQHAAQVYAQREFADKQKHEQEGT